MGKLEDELAKVTTLKITTLSNQEKKLKIDQFQGSMDTC
jgi:hypothetical protein